MARSDRRKRLRPRLVAEVALEDGSQPGRAVENARDSHLTPAVAVEHQYAHQQRKRCGIT
jgi:hypothetical protein